MNEIDLDTVAKLITPRVSRMAQDEITDCEGLFDTAALDDVPPYERDEVYFFPVLVLADQGKVPLELVGFNRNRRNLYRKK